ILDKIGKSQLDDLKKKGPIEQDEDKLITGFTVALAQKLLQNIGFHEEMIIPVVSRLESEDPFAMPKKDEVSP
ncbi:hypothetical protein COY95_05095, partial [Candidatus Woesearchaeota archaeon CG_4_10_14_0_8_um_filter_47_5]